jgi:hypothetical protein
MIMILAKKQENQMICASSDHQALQHGKTIN